MNDFLKNLRGATKDKRLNQVRTNIDRRGDAERRSSSPKRPIQQPDTRIDEIEKNIANIQNTLQNLNSSLVRFFTESFERHLQLVERKAILFENILPYLDGLLEKSVEQAGETKKSFSVKETAANTEPQAKRGKKVKASVRKAPKSGKNSGGHKKDADKQRAEILDRIYALRLEGKSFEQITKVLREEKTPTLSNRGQWHAQTVHRLCRNLDATSEQN